MDQLRANPLRYWSQQVWYIPYSAIFVFTFVGLRVCVCICVCVCVCTYICVCIMSALSLSTLFQLEPYHGAPHIYIDVPHTLPLLPGGTLHIYCYILGATPPATPLATPLEVEVLKDGRWQLAGSPDVAESPFKQVYVIETGSYTCRLIDNGTILSADTVEVVPGNTVCGAMCYL